MFVVRGTERNYEYNDRSGLKTPNLGMLCFCVVTMVKWTGSESFESFLQRLEHKLL